MKCNLLVVTAAALALAPAASQAYTVDFGFTANGGIAPITVTGDITTSDTLDVRGAYDVTSISGTLTDASGSTPITGLVTNPSQPFAYNNGTWIYDNVVFDSFPYVDNPGVLFSTANYDFNIYTVGSTPGSTTWYLSSNDPNGWYNPGQVVGSGWAAVVPEPSTWAMLGLGFAGLGFAAARRSKNAIAALA